MTNDYHDLTDSNGLQIPPARYDFKNKLVLITGGAQGIGRCLSLSFASCGAKVLILDINQEACCETAALAERMVPESIVSWQVTDLSIQEDIEVAINRFEPDLSRNGLFVLVNNAAITNAHHAHLKSEDLSAFDRVLEVNLRAPYIMSAKLQNWLAQAGGSIINIASTRAFMSEPRSEAYGASKGGIVALTHAMASTLGDNRVRVNCISPGWIATEEWQQGSPEAAEFTQEDHLQHPAGRVGRPADIAAACLFLASEDAGFITGVNLTVDGGMTHKMIYK